MDLFIARMLIFVWIDKRRIDRSHENSSPLYCLPFETTIFWSNAATTRFNVGENDNWHSRNHWNRSFDDFFFFSPYVFRRAAVRATVSDATKHKKIHQSFNYIFNRLTILWTSSSFVASVSAVILSSSDIESRRWGKSIARIPGKPSMIAMVFMEQVIWKVRNRNQSSISSLSFPKRKKNRCLTLSVSFVINHVGQNMHPYGSASFFSFFFSVKLCWDEKKRPDR